MRQTLIRIPLEGPWSLGPLGEIPGFGLGIVLLIWTLAAVFWIFRHRHELAFNKETIVPVAVWFVFASAILSVPHFVRSHYTQLLKKSDRIVQTTDPELNGILHRLH